MKKSFKKVIAVLLSVLMITCAIPFSAFAANEVKPNVDLQFNAFSYAQSGKNVATNYSTSMRINYLNRTGINNVPLDYDKNAGTLTLNAAKAAGVVAKYGCAAIDSDYTYGVGDYFTVTVRLDNVSKIAATQVALNYSDNIEPAGLWPTSANGATMKWCSISDTLQDYTSNSNIVKARPGYPIPAQSAAGLYAGLNDGLVGDASYIDNATKTIYTYVSNQDGNPSTSVAAVSDGSTFTNEDGTLGNTYENKAILATYAFKIMGEGPITFSLADSNNVDDCYYLADEADGKTEAAYQTYAQTDAAGSTGITFMGKNEFVAGTSYTVVFKNTDGSVISQATYDEGASVVVPDLPTKAADADNHYSYAWDKTPAATATEDAIYTAVETATKHTMTEEIIQDATTTEEGTKRLTCDICGYTTTETIPVKTCDHANTTVTEEVTKAATCKEAGSKIVTTTCSDCGEVVSTETVEIPKTAHSFGAYVYNEDAVYTSSKSYKDGTATATCTVCGEADTKVIAGTGLLRANSASVTLGAAVVLNIKFAKTRAASFDSTYTVLTFNGNEYVLDDESRITDPTNANNWQYEFDEIAPQYFADTVTITMYGVKDGITCKGFSVDYSIKKYCTSQLSKAANGNNLKTLLVEILYYGEMDRVYRKNTTSVSPIEGLTDAQKALHTTNVPTYTKATNVKYELNTGVNEITFKSATVELLGAVNPRIKVEYDKTHAVTDYEYRFVVNGAETVVDYETCPEAFIPTTASTSTKVAYFISLQTLKAFEFSDPFYLTVYKKDGTRVSDTLCYSVESYAFSSAYKGNAALRNLVDQLLRYGRATKTWYNNKNG